MSKEIKISKYEAAEWQLKEVIHLFFEGRNSLAIHTIAFAVHNILNDLISKFGGTKVLKNESMIMPDKLSEYISVINKAGNFLKHADKDPDGTLTFNETINEYFIFDCCMMHDQLPRPRLKEATVYKIWFAIKYPKFIKGGLATEAQKYSHLASQSNRDLFREILHQLHLVPDIPVILPVPP